MSLNELVFSDGFAVLYPLFRIVYRLDDTVVNYTQTSSRNTESAAHQSRVSNPEALSDRAEQVVLGDAAIIQEDRSSIGGLHPQLVFLLLRRVPFEFLLNN